jgi:DNA-nicking Smr family endonuclease
VPDDLKDWLEFKSFVLKDKKVEKCKNEVQTLPHDRKHIIPREMPLQIHSRPNLVREIVLSDVACVERSIIKKLRTGAMPIDISIDLHGYTIDQAYRFFYKSLHDALSQGMKLMLIITGKGSKEGNSIRSQLMNWVNLPEISGHIIYITHAIQKHGGEGAFYVVLRKDI